MSSVDFTAINEAALAQCSDLLEKLLPGGKLQGQEYVCGSLAGGEGSSCSVNLNSGKWSDFATGESGKDLIALVAAQQEVNQFEGARILARMIGFTLQEDARPKQSDKAGNKPRPIMPVPEGIAEPAINHPRHGKPTEVYRYLDRQGRLLGYVCRFALQEVNGNGKRKKEFAPYVFTGRGWKSQDFSKPYPFYGLQNLSKTPPEAPIIILEGEGKADALQAVRGQNKAVLGVYGGSSRIGTMDYSLLANRSVIYWPDNDPAGAKAAIQFAKLALNHAKSVKIIQPPRDVKPTWDCADAIAEGWDHARFRDWISANRLDPAEFEKLAAKRWGIGQQEKEPEKQERAPLVCVNVADFIQMEIPAREMLLAPILPKQGLAMIHAMRGVGKTFVGLCLAYAVASGGEVFGRWQAPTAARVVYLDGEMPAITLQERITAIAAASVHDITAPENLRFVTPDLQPENMPNLATPEGQEALEPFIADADFVIVDNLSTLCRYGRANDEESWQPIQEWFLSLRRRGKSALVVHHQNKGGDQRGTGAKEDILDTVIALKRPADYEMCQGARFEVHLTKARGICGDEAKPFEAALEMKNGNFKWKVSDLEENKQEQMREMLASGMRMSEIAEVLGVNRCTLTRWKKKLGITDK